uniref:Uncharacterized protein n=1 Tax=Ralstonia solanacearum TaxID=305 RepID=A0A0S4U2Q9_RALSL|nr:protein of unknown function [Ralstonia solanacearum]
MEADGKQIAKPYPTDVSDEEWGFAVAYLSLMDAKAPQRMYDLREMFTMACAGWRAPEFRGACCRARLRALAGDVGRLALCHIQHAHACPCRTDLRHLNVKLHLCHTTW